jgi:sugar phosphate isomerase/epimerase
MARAASDASSERWRVGIYTRPWDKFDYREALDAIAEAGYKHVGLMTTTSEQGRLVLSVDVTPKQAEQVAEEVRRRDLQVASVYGGGIPVAKSLEAGIEGMKKLIDHCVTVGARSLLMGGIGRENLYEAYYKAIAETCDYAAEKGLAITVKPHGGLNATGAQCRKCVEMVGKENFSLWYDPGNIFFYSYGKIDPVDDAATVDGLVTEGICIKDFTMSTVNDEVTRDVMVTPGEGMVDFPKVLARLKQGGFTSGDLVIECLNRGDGQPATILAEAKKAREFVEGLVAEGWQVLFNGVDLAGWQGTDGGPPNPNWVVENGTLVRKGKASYIWTKERFGDFVLDLEYMTEGNSGVFIRTDDRRNCVQTGIEVAINKQSPDTTTHTTGALYDLLAPSKAADRPTGEWNHMTISARDNKIAVVVNGESVVDADLNRWTEANKNPDGSRNKFRTPLKDFKREGHIGFQDHGATVAFRNVRIKRLD